MKSSSGSEPLLVVLLGLLFAGPARASVAEQGNACLDIVDVACAQTVAANAGNAPADVRFRARLAFHLAQFDEAVRLEESVQAAFAQDPSFAQELALYKATRDATAGFVTERRGDVEIRYLPGTDLVLLDDAFTTLQAAHDRIAPRLGGGPPGPMRVELYPTASRFIAASGLGEDAVRTTGVVALSKWSRLLVTSPRALMRGYAWKDTIAHEYTHYVVAWRTKDRTPVWLQEGIARSHETLWRVDTLSTLPSFEQSLLANALSTDSLITLEQMHPSMAYLPSADAAALAFAQVSTMVEYLDETAGDDATKRALDEVREGKDALQAVADVGSGGDPEAFKAAWRTWLGKMDLVARKLTAPRTVLDGAGDENGIDPVLAQRQDLANYAHLGDLLMQAGRADAALIELRKAIPPDEPPSPMLSTRLARALAALGRNDEAIRTLQVSIADYAEYASTRKALGALLLAQGKTTDALAQYRASADVNPFDPDVQAALADLYTAVGQPDEAARHRRYRQILVLGGAELASGDVSR